jgi:transcriptional regulator with XRE-family HTH domain
MLDRQVNDGIPRVAYVEPMETMGDRIKTLREARGLTQLDVGQYCGVSKGAVSHWENGVTADIKLKTFLRLLEILKTDYEYLVFGAERQPSHPNPDAPQRLSRKA